MQYKYFMLQVSLKLWGKMLKLFFFFSNEMSSLHINYIVITELPGGKEFLLLLAKIKIITDG